MSGSKRKIPLQRCRTLVVAMCEPTHQDMPATAIHTCADVLGDLMKDLKRRPHARPRRPPRARCGCILHCSRLLLQQ